MRIRIVSIFPEMFDAITGYGITSRAVEDGTVSIELFNLREYGQGTHRMVDDRPYGGGPGMVMLAKPIINCVNDAKTGLDADVPVVYLSPQGRRLEHADVCDLALLPSMVLLCGRYAGVDQRALDIIGVQEWSIGDYVLTGGELAAMVMIDAIVRQIPGVVGNQQSPAEDSFADGLLDCARYTRPQTLSGIPIPEVLASGDHEQIRLWRLKQAIGQTWLRRPDLLEKMQLNEEQSQALATFKEEYDK